MLIKAKRCLTLILLPIILSSCSRLMNWGRKTFNQGCSVKDSLNCYKKLIRSTKVYDQLSTLGIFDSVILTKDVVDAYNKAAKANLKFSGTAFFILAFADRTDYKPLNSELTNEWAWHMYLMVNDKKLEPLYQKCISLPSEFKMLFGDKYTRFKSSYLVEFEKVRLDGMITLCFKSLRKTTAISWRFKNGKLLELGKPCNYYKDCEYCKC